ncbi:hypothetical protein EDEG_04168 [Edhazardia aedis USNM 41457]|uniref:Uncharacterized protein n=1 Tax=Edhazardia aedis (strain USNM 41457) TaxID=1003232 RepID=J9DBP7_EDHAE|nr:hypothetical protein EDEG_04168 [Edhazardia aedis USNM 41457]|eukprot:EJW04914.1 hypothetical protein EDEG_04168 [Edhazardia aedis USNM 41457]
MICLISIYLYFRYSNELSEIGCIIYFNGAPPDKELDIKSIDNADHKRMQHKAIIFNNNSFLKEIVMNYAKFKMSYDELNKEDVVFDECDELFLDIYKDEILSEICEFTNNEIEGFLGIHPKIFAVKNEEFEVQNVFPNIDFAKSTVLKLIKECFSEKNQKNQKMLEIRNYFCKEFIEYYISRNKKFSEIINYCCSISNNQIISFNQYIYIYFLEATKKIYLKCDFLETGISILKSTIHSLKTNNYIYELTKSIHLKICIFEFIRDIFENQPITTRNKKKFQKIFNLKERKVLEKILSYINKNKKMKI